MAERSYPHMLSPVRIGGVEFRNRVWSATAAMFLLMDDTRNITDETVAYYRRKAAGGTACVTVSAQDMDLWAPPNPYHGNLNILDVSSHDSWRALTAAIHEEGARASLELLAFGYSLPDPDGRPVRYGVMGGRGERALDREAMERIAALYGSAAACARDCGFDAVLVHGGHGLPLGQMISSAFNRRTDEFGGSLENRARFPLMILDAIQERVGRDLLIEYRISGDEYSGADGNFGIEECAAFLKLVQDRIDIAHVSAGGFATGTDDLMAPSQFEDAGRNVYLAEAIKADPDIHLPVLTLGALQMPDDIERVIAEGKADLVAMARGTIADPCVVRKAASGRADEVIPCIRCFHCLDYGRASELACSVNPTVGREVGLPAADDVEPAEVSKRLVVVGGGPAGMQAAITARRRGHEVVLLEKGDRPGGTLALFDGVPFKRDLCSFRDYLIRMVGRLGVDVRLGCEATPELVAAFSPDAVIAATGASYLRPDVPGINGENVITASDVYRAGEKLEGDSFVVIGGGETGCETGVYLAETLGKGTVYVTKRGGEFAPSAGPIARGALMKHLQKSCLPVARTHVREVREGSVIAEQAGYSYELPADKVVLACGMEPNADAAARLDCGSWELHVIGDCAKVGSVRTAVRQGFDAAMEI